MHYEKIAGEGGTQRLGTSHKCLSAQNVSDAGEMTRAPLKIHKGTLCRDCCCNVDILTKLCSVSLLREKKERVYMQSLRVH